MQFLVLPKNLLKLTWSKNKLLRNEMWEWEYYKTHGWGRGYREVGYSPKLYSFKAPDFFIGLYVFYNNMLLFLHRLVHHPVLSKSLTLTCLNYGGWSKTRNFAIKVRLGSPKQTNWEVRWLRGLSPRPVTLPYLMFIEYCKYTYSKKLS